MARVPSRLVVLAGLLFFPETAGAQSFDPYATELPSVASPFWGYTSDPYSGYFQGAASVIRAQAQFMVSREQAALTREMVRAAKIDNRKKELEHWAWEREFVFNTISAERERIRQYEIERSRTDPPLADIVSAKALNDLLGELKKLPELPAAVSVPVEQDWLPNIHVTSGVAGNAGLLKSEQLPWPMLLRRQDFAADRERFEKQLAVVRQKVVKGNVTPEDYTELKHALIGLDAQLRAANKEAGGNDAIWGPSHFVGARRFLRELNDVVVVLEVPDAHKFLNPLQGKTVSELVARMKASGLKFAPATRGTERHYTALHRALAEALTRAK